MGGKRLNNERIVLRDLRRNKHHEKKEKAREQVDLRENYGFSDTEVEKECGFCHNNKSDVYRFRVALPIFVSDINPDGTEMEICPRCKYKFDNAEVRMKALPELTAADMSPNRNIYDQSKPRKRLF